MKSINKRSNLIGWFLKRPKIAGLLVSLILCIVLFYVVSQRYQIVKENKEKEMENILSAVQQNIGQSLKNCYATTLTLALIINDDNGVPQNFDKIASQLLASNSSINSVQLVPDGIIRYIYPMKGNEAAMGLNILKSKNLRKEALQSVANKKMYFAGPFELVQGGTGIVGRFPVYNENKFWGFSAVVIRLETLFKTSGISTIDTSKYYFQLSKINPNTSKEEFFLPMVGDFSTKNYVSKTISDGDWKIYLISKNPNDVYAQLIVPTVLGFILALFFGVFILLIFRKPAELQLLVNEQATKLFNSEIKFKTIFDQASVGIARIDSYTGYFMEVNEKHRDLLGYTLEEIKNKNFQSVTYAEDLAADLSNLEKLRQGEIREYSMEKRYITKLGEIIWVNITVSPMWQINETVTTHIAIVEDISAKKEGEELLKKSEVRFKSLFDDSPLALWEEDYSAVKKYLAELNLINEDPQIVTAFLQSHPEIMQKCFSLIKVLNVNNQCLIEYAPKTKLEHLSNTDILFGKELPHYFIKHLVAICQGNNHLNIEAQIKNPKNEIRDIHLIYSVVKGYEDTLERVIIATEDITERKSAEKKALNTQQKIESLINTVDGIVWECDVETLHFSFISKKVKDILGYNPEEWTSNPNFWKDHIHPDDSQWVQQFCKTNTDANLNHDFEYRMIAKSGASVWLRDIVNIIIENGRATSMRGIMIDITETKKAEKELNNSFNLVTEQNQRLLNFSYIVSHNLRSHTSNISSIVNLIEISETQEERDEMVQLLKTVSESLNDTMVHLNEVINIRTNIGLVSQSIDLKQYIDTAQNVLTEQIALNDVSITTTIPKNVMVNYNPAYLESILYNIISNSIRYRHPERKPEISIDWFLENDMNVLQISDNGVGIDLVKNADKIFGMYKTFSNNPDSKGIGLFITKNQIEAMGGSITVESQPNMGTTFKIYIQ
ncbi:PAS domain S-box protein [Flavobacterium degerlachei]|jgi:PAS domain S-box-containing protein|uniref:histidine kinase n=1 Tax=Flavobacterium degerlachei TaxID=229203 RepID=A0A1H3BVN2_9FLAO|nr:PAS domain S-box protein [Flavobacterium degerlachei]SDX45708.1 PAS domain S-box-containing protein [Flavobacterium degerlachei]